MNWAVTKSVPCPAVRYWGKFCSKHTLTFRPAIYGLTSWQLGTKF